MQSSMEGGMSNVLNKQLWGELPKKTNKPSNNNISYQSCTALKESSLVISYMRTKPMAPR